MKKTIIAMALLLVAGSVQQTDAQQRRRTTTKKTTTVRKTTTQQRTAPVEKFVKEVAFYDVKVIDFCVDGNYIYYVEPLPNNAVMRIDRKTGEISTVLPGIANVYEGRRDIIQRIDVAAGKLILRHSKNNYDIGLVGVLMQDGTYMGSKDWEAVVQTSGDYALLMRRDSGSEVFDAKNMIIKNIKDLPNTGEGDAVGAVLKYSDIHPVIDSNGCVWHYYWGNRKFGVCRKSATGNMKFFDLSTQAYVVSEGIGAGNDFDKPINWLTSMGPYLYASCKRRIYRLNMLNPTGWEEYAKIPPTLDSSFHLFWPDWKGNILNDDNGFRKNCWFYRVGAFETPQSLSDGKAISTGMNKFGWSEIWPSLCKVRVDLDNNYIVSGGSSITIYNPDGVVGFDAARGKIVKP